MPSAMSNSMRLLIFQEIVSPLLYNTYTSQKRKRKRKKRKKKKRMKNKNSEEGEEGKQDRIFELSYPSP